MRLVKLLSYLFINIVRLFNLRELYQPTYNPKNYLFIRSKSKKRGCDDRLSVIKENIDMSQINSYLDIGSQLGYFVFKLSELSKNTIACGMEMDAVCCTYANAVVSLNNLKNISFSNTKITPDIAEKIPNHDMMSFLSVFHHIAHFEGFESADEIMRKLYSRCNRYFIFETGQYNEKGHYWSESLNFMGEDPVQWIKEYLSGLGYSKVRLIMNAETHLSGEQRGLFLCEKV